MSYLYFCACACMCTPIWKFLDWSNLATTLKGCNKVATRLWYFMQGVHNLEGLLQPSMMVVKLYSTSTC